MFMSASQETQAVGLFRLQRVAQRAAGRTIAKITAVMVPLVLYAALSYLYFGRGHSLTAEYFGNGPDPLQFIWFIHWWPFAVAHHLNPFVTKYVWFPEGINVTWLTSIPFAALLALPFGNPVVAFNLLTLAAPALSAWTAFLLCRHLSRDRIAALLGGYLYGFSSYELGHLFGHLNLDMIFLVPLAVLLCVRRAQGQIARRPFVALLALVFLAQFGLSSEILATLCLFGAMTWALFLLSAPKEGRADLWPLAIEIPAAAALMVLLALPFVVYLVKGLGDFVPVPAPEIADYSSDLLGFLTPTVVTRIGRTAYGPLAARFNPNYAETGIYLGIPLMALLAAYFASHIKRPHVRALLLATCLLAVFSLGPWLHIGGVQLPPPMPWHLALGLPLIKSAMPERFVMYVALATAVAAALWLAVPAERPKRLLKLSLGGASCLFIAPNLSIHRWTPWPADRFFTPTHIQAALGKSPNVLILPYGGFGSGMAWQVDANFAFTQSGGYTGAAPPSENAWPVLADFQSGTPSPRFAANLEAFCASHHVDFILIGPGTPAPLAAAVEAQGWPQHRDGDIEVIKAPPAQAVVSSSH
jgi:hypothetical protein